MDDGDERARTVLRHAEVAAAGVTDVLIAGGRVAAVQPDLDFRVVPGAGHWVNWEAAETVNSFLAEMLSQPD